MYTYNYNYSLAVLTLIQDQYAAITITTDQTLTTDQLHTLKSAYENVVQDAGFQALDPQVMISLCIDIWKKQLPDGDAYIEYTIEQENWEVSIGTRTSDPIAENRNENENENEVE